jgi:hypothetical protein
MTVVTDRTGTEMKVISLRIDSKLFDEIRTLADFEDRSINRTIVQAIKSYIKNSKEDRNGR